MNCDPDRCDYAIDAPQLGCGERPCPEHDPDEVVQWNDGRDSDWLHDRGTCNECDRCWEDVDANTAYYAAELVTASQTDRQLVASLTSQKGSEAP